MSNPTGFKQYQRKTLGYRPSAERRLDFLEIYKPPEVRHLRDQAARCMDCGVPFCQSNTGCPLGNQIPEWNHHAYEGDWAEALQRLEETNNFPEFTGRVCPAPCEGACVLGIHESPVTIREIESAIADRGWNENWIQPQPPRVRTGRLVSIVGSGPAGLATAQQLNRSGHTVKVYERYDRPGGLLTYGIPNMKLEKEIVQRRIAQLEAEGVEFLMNSDVGRAISIGQVTRQSDAVLLAIGAGAPRDIEADGRELGGIHFAMEYLTASTRGLIAGADPERHLHAQDRSVVVIGAGDTATDCIATAVRQGAASVVNLEIALEPPVSRDTGNPWPEWPKVLRTEYGHHEAIDRYGSDPRSYQHLTRRFVGNNEGHVCAVETVKVDHRVSSTGVRRLEEIHDSLHSYPADLVLIAAGFIGPEAYLLDQLGIEPKPHAPCGKSQRVFHTRNPKVFSAGDCRRGQSLVVWAIEEGRTVATEIDRYLGC